MDPANRFSSGQSGQQPSLAAGVNTPVVPRVAVRMTGRKTDQEVNTEVKAVMGERTKKQKEGNAPGRTRGKQKKIRKSRGEGEATEVRNGLASDTKIEVGSLGVQAGHAKGIESPLVLATRNEKAATTIAAEGVARELGDRLLRTVPETTGREREIARGGEVKAKEKGDDVVRLHFAAVVYAHPGHYP